MYKYNRRPTRTPAARAVCLAARDFARVLSGAYILEKNYVLGPADVWSVTISRCLYRTRLIRAMEPAASGRNAEGIPPPPYVKAVPGPSHMGVRGGVGFSWNTLPANAFQVCFRGDCEFSKKKKSSRWLRPSDWTSVAA